MTREEIVEGLKLLEDNMVHFDELQNDKGEWIDVHELLFEAIQALEQQPCDDVVNRQAVLDAICDYVAFEEYEDKSHTFTIRPLEKRINEIPSVTQKSAESEDKTE